MTFGYTRAGKGNSARRDTYKDCSEGMMAGKAHEVVAKIRNASERVGDGNGKP